jgi:hypothetical protein
MNSRLLLQAKVQRKAAHWQGPSHSNNSHGETEPEVPVPDELAAEPDSPGARNVLAAAPDELAAAPDELAPLPWTAGTAGALFVSSEAGQGEGAQGPVQPGGG